MDQAPLQRANELPSNKVYFYITLLLETTILGRST